MTNFSEQARSRRRRATLRARLQYGFDNVMARGGASVLLAILVILLICFALLTLLRLGLMAAFPEASLTGTADAGWRTFIQLLDPGGMYDDQEGRLVHKVMGLATVSAGLIFFSSLIAFVNNLFDNKVAELRKGRSAVIESDHTIVIGFGDSTVEVVRQLVQAMASEARPAVVIASARDKVEMDDELQETLPQRFGVRLITRSGDVNQPRFLRRMSVPEARSIIVLNPASVAESPSDREHGDARVLETLIALTAAVGDEPLPPVVAQIHTAAARRLAEGLAPGRITMVDTNDILARILVYTSMSPGLAFVYAQLVGFEGHEVYFHRPEGGWLGHDFGKLQFHFINTVLLGFKTRSGELLINPPVSYVPADDDRGILLAEDDSTIRFYKRQVASPKPMPYFRRKPRILIERQLVVGWSSKVERILTEYAQAMHEGSTVHLLVCEARPDQRRLVERLDSKYGAVRVALMERDVGDPAVLARLDLERYDNILILADEAAASLDEMDLRSISRLLEFRQALRDREAALGRPLATNLITEVLDAGKSELFFKAGARDFLVPHRFVSEIIAQISQEPEVRRFYDHIFDEEGSEVHVKPAELYFPTLPSYVSFADCVKAAQLRGEVCLGVRVDA
ncbi:MAG: CASTOR/POLLUX-related putative ion channel [Planctomycetota bacterium]|jgi:hypothetical protein